MGKIDKTVLDVLQKDFSKKSKVYDEIMSRRRNRERKLMAEVVAKLDDEFGAEVNAANVARNEAETLLKAEVNRIRAIESLGSLPYPLGTKLIEWKRPRFSCIGGMSKTGKVAVLEILKEGDSIPDNIRWSKPRIGSIVLRMLKKNGTRSSHLEEWYDLYKCYWFPEGVEPKKE